MTYSLIFLADIPAFYKINLYNRIEEKIRCKDEKMLVIFRKQVGGIGRNSDFFKGKMQFEHVFLKGGKNSRCKQLYKIIRHTDYSQLVISGWDTRESRIAALVSPKQKNSVVVESSILESTTTGVKGVIKRLFINRIGNKAYVPGVSNAKLVESLGFKGEIVYTKGVGVFNYIPQPLYTPRKVVKNFLYVGRLVDAKNLRLLIKVFNSLPQLTLTIAGFGEQEQELKAMANDSIKFLGAVENKKLPQVYQANDVFVLPSKKEAWGLVVEEALNNGLPVIVSDRVGCHEAIVNDGNGIVFSPFDSEAALSGAVLRMTDITYNNSLRKNISQLDFAKTEEEQVECYV